MALQKKCARLALLMITASVVVIVICRTQSSENNDEKSSKTHNLAVVALILGIFIGLCSLTEEDNSKQHEETKIADAPKTKGQDDHAKNQEDAATASRLHANPMNQR